MSRGRKKTVIEEPVIEDVPEIVEDVVAEEPVQETEVVEEPKHTDVARDKASELAYVKQILVEHSRRRPGSVSGMLPSVYRLTLPGGRVRFFTLPINVEEGAVEDCWKRCRSFMSAEEYIAFVVSVVNIPRPAFYSSFRVITLD